VYEERGISTGMDFYQPSEHLKSIKKIKFGPNEYIITELNKSTKTLLGKMKISFA
jgi:hypothetical protein